MVFFGCGINRTTVHDHALERNDWFAVVFSIPSIALFYYFSQVNYNRMDYQLAWDTLLWNIYSIAFHDIIVHQRLKWRPENEAALQRMIHAHYVHHSKHTKEDLRLLGFDCPQNMSPEFLFKKDRQETQ